MKKQFLIFLFLLTQIFAKKKTKLTKKLSSNDQNVDYTFTPKEVNFESLCHNLKEKFSFAIVVSDNINYSGVFNNKFNLVSLTDGTEIPTFCTLYAGDKEIICSTTEDKPTNAKGPFRVAKVPSFTFNCNVGNTNVNKKCKFDTLDFSDTVGYSKLFSTYDLTTPNQTIDYTKSTTPSFYLKFDYIDEQSDTKVFYYDEDDEQNYEITTCDFAEYSDLVLECPVTKATLPCSASECKYQIFLRDDCGIESDAITLTVIGKKTATSNTNTGNGNYGAYSGSVGMNVGKYLMGLLMVILV